MDKFSEFDRRLAEDAGRLPPKEAQRRKCSPFRVAVRNIVAGLALQVITLNFLKLQYILPMVGAVLLYLGFRSLRRENRWFTACWVICTVRLLLKWAHLLLMATPLAVRIGHTSGFDPGTWIKLLGQLLFYFCFRQALRTAWRRLGRRPSGDPMLWCMVWYTAMVVLAAVNTGTVLAWGGLIWYILILCSVWKAGKSLEAVGYTLTAAPVRLSGSVVGWSALLLTLVPVFLLSAWFTRPAMDWAERPEESAQTELRQELLNLGFPEQVLNDLSDEDLAGYEGTVHVHWEKTARDQVELITVSAAGPESMRVLHWFHWMDMPVLRTGDFFSVDWYWGDNTYDNLTGRVLLQREGKTYAAPLEHEHLELVTWETADMGAQAGVQKRLRLMGHLSLPLAGSDFRGYVVYDYFHGPDPEWKVYHTVFNYYHQNRPILYPWKEFARYDSSEPYTLWQNSLYAQSWLWFQREHE